MNEKEILENEFEKPMILVTYTAPQQINESVAVKKYDIQVDKDTRIRKIDVLFAFEFAHYAALKAGIRVNPQVEDQKLKPIPKPKNRPVVATKEAYKSGTGTHVKLTMRTGHMLTGEQLADTKYNLILNIEDKLVLIYKHGILEYEAQQEGEIDGSRTEK